MGTKKLEQREKLDKAREYGQEITKIVKQKIEEAEEANLPLGTRGIEIIDDDDQAALDEAISAMNGGNMKYTDTGIRFPDPPEIDICFPGQLQESTQEFQNIAEETDQTNDVMQDEFERIVRELESLF